MDEALDRELRALRASDAHPIEVIKLIRARMGVELDEAKLIFASHPAWTDVHELTSPSTTQPKKLRGVSPNPPNPRAPLHARSERPGELL
jgi:hypothetical protein